MNKILIIIIALIAVFLLIGYIFLSRPFVNLTNNTTMINNTVYITTTPYDSTDFVKLYGSADNSSIYDNYVHEYRTCTSVFKGIQLSSNSCYAMGTHVLEGIPDVLCLCRDGSHRTDYYYLNKTITDSNGNALSILCGDC